jgi:hypothetical protein
VSTALVSELDVSRHVAICQHPDNCFKGSIVGDDVGVDVGVDEGGGGGDDAGVGDGMIFINEIVGVGDGEGVGVGVGAGVGAGVGGDADRKIDGINSFGKRIQPASKQIFLFYINKLLNTPQRLNLHLLVAA